jgi:hypothetical protein
MQLKFIYVKGSYWIPVVTENVGLPEVLYTCILELLILNLG